MTEPISRKALFVEGPRRERELTFYSLSTCAMCRKAREYLDQKGYAYRLLWVDQLASEDKRRLKEELSLKHGVRVVFPALQIDGSRLVLGFFRAAWDQALAQEGARG